MTPAARVAAAAELLDEVLRGQPAERVLTRWGRRSRFAGSRDREAVRDLVFDALRRRRSYATLGGAETGRGLMLGALRAAGTDPDEIFTGQGHAPDRLTDIERDPSPRPPSRCEALDCPDWLWPRLERSLGDRVEPVLSALRQRAPVTVRVNLRKTNPEAAARQLAEGGIGCRPGPLSPTALVLTENARALQRSAAYADGLVELQDAASQAAADCIPVPDGARVLDLCAGGGGKTLALAGRADAIFHAHDADPDRMKDLPARAARAGVAVEVLDRAAVSELAPFDVVVVDAPCSGSGAWRRSPEAKWRLTADRLDELVRVQGGLLAQAAELTAAGGVLAYITCSLLEDENEGAISAFLEASPDWSREHARRFLPDEGGDGFYVAILRKPA